MFYFSFLFSTIIEFNELPSVKISVGAELQAVDYSGLYYH